MDNVIIVFSQLVSLLLIAVIGWILGKRQLLKDSNVLSTLLTKAALPAFALTCMEVEYSGAMARSMIVAMAGMALMMAASMLVGFLTCVIARPRDKQTTGNWITSIGSPNAIYMGQPLMIALFGEAIRPLTGGMLIVFNLVTFTVGVSLMSMGSHSQAISMKARLRRILLTPAVLSSLGGFLLFVLNWHLPGPVYSSLSSLGSMTTPIAMLIIGCELSKAPLRELFVDWRIYLVSVARLAAAPLAAWCLLKPLIADPQIFGVLIVASAMPVASIVTVIAQEQNNNVLFTSRVSLLSTLLCLFTAPIIIWLLL